MSLFVVPQYLGRGSTYFSYVPVVVVEPASLLSARASLPGAMLFDRTCLRYNTQAIDMPRDLVFLAAVPTLAVSATWASWHVLRVERLWESDPHLPNDLCPPGQMLENTPPEEDFCAALERVVGGVSGIGYANITKAIATARPSMYPMFDSWLQHGLRASDRSDADWQDRDCLQFYFGRFRRLLIAQLNLLAGVESPVGFTYSATQKLDRLLWLAHFGATFYFGKPDSQPREWSSISGLPSRGLLTGATRYSLRHARVVLPTSSLSSSPGNMEYSGLSRSDQTTIDDVLDRAATMSAAFAWRK